MWGVVRTGVGMLFVCLIVFIVVSPYIDLPVTTLTARQAVTGIVATIALCGRLGQELRLAEGLQSNLEPGGLRDAYSMPLTDALLC